MKKIQISPHREARRRFGRYCAMLCAWLILALALPLPAVLAEQDFSLDERALIAGMERTWAQGYAPTLAENRVSVCLPVRCDAAKGRITAALEMDESISPFRQQTMSASFQRNEQGVYPVRLQLRLLSDWQDGDYAAIVHLNGTDDAGAPLSADYPVTIRLRGGAANSEAISPVLSLDAQALDVGEDGEAALEIANPCRRVDMRDVQLTLSDASGEILPASGGVIRLGDLAAGQSLTARIPLSVLPDAKVRPHALELKLSYSALDEARTWTEAFTVPVTQQIQLAQGGVQMPTTALQNRVTSLTLPLMNLGRGVIRNAMVTLNLPGVTEDQTVLVGGIEPGATKEAKISFTPRGDFLGQSTGRIEVRGEDDWGNSASFSLPVALTVEAEPDVSIAVDAAADEPDRTIPALPLACACGALALALIAQALWYRHRLRRLEEARL